MSVISPPSTESAPGVSETDVGGQRRTQPESEHFAHLHLEAGQSVGRYKLLRRIGAGGMGVVYEAYDPGLERRVALKMLHASDAGTQGDSADSQVLRAQMEQRMLREAKALARLSHPNVISIYDVGSFDGCSFLAMDFIVGETLADWIHAGKRSWQAVLGRLLPAGEGLAAAHAQGLVHRDFKPDNVMLASDGRVLVLDFGLVKTEAIAHETLDTEENRPRSLLSMSSQGGTSRSGRGELTAVGDVIGTPSYIAPEHYLGASADDASDQYSFCVAMFEALYGVCPFRGRDRMAIARAALAGRLSEYPKSRAVPTWLHEIVLKGLSADPRDRFADLPTLLATIRRRTGRKQRYFQGVSWALGAMAVCALTVVQAVPQMAGDVCSTAADRWATTVSGERLARVKSQFETVAPSRGAEAFRKSALLLSDYGEDWQALRGANCRVMQAQDQSAALRNDLQASCLNSALAATDALVGAFEEADAKLVDRSVRALAKLPDLQHCSDAERLQLAVSQTGDVRHRRVVAELAPRVARVKALNAAGKLHQALAESETLLEDSRRLDSPTSAAEVMLTRGYIHRQLANSSEAIEEHEAALEAAVAAGARELAARASLELVYERAYLAQDLEAGWQALPLAEARLRQIGEPARHVGTLERYRGILHGLSGDHVGSEAAFRRAHDLFLSVYGELHPVTASAVANLAAANFFQHRYAEAAGLFARATEIVAEVLGETHPTLVQQYRNLGSTRWELGDFSGTRQAFARAAELCRMHSSGDDLQCALAEVKVAELEILLGQHEQARRILGRVHAVQTRLGHRGNPTAAWAAELLADLELSRGEVLRAKPWAELAWSQTEAEAQVSPQRATEVVLLRARLASHLGQPEDALVWVQRGRRQLDGPSLEARAQRAQLDLAEGEALCALGRASEAVAMHARATREFSEIFGVDNANMIGPLMAHAEAELRAGQRAPALQRAQQAMNLHLDYFPTPNTQRRMLQLRLTKLALESGDLELASRTITSLRASPGSLAAPPWIDVATRLLGARLEGKARLPVKGRPAEASGAGGEAASFADLPELWRRPTYRSCRWGSWWRSADSL